MANRPFQSSASAFMTPSPRLSAVSPLSTGTSDATDSTAAVAKNHVSPPPLPACARRPPPRDASTASAETKPTMASRPLIRSGAGPLNASASIARRLRAAFGFAASGWRSSRSRGRRRRGSARLLPRDAAARARTPGHGWQRGRRRAAAKVREPMEAITVAAIGACCARGG
ncbi:hypothetical protein HU200_000396 [Digitaria exilis]|uniref:Uncharacterized protein n=1 Tax=Digitaria exilis TaxID=1010633 RepID=A0A835G1M1_9POAL|nr:hypothetical protein HU200_000396 [Digitaria exilis]